MFDWTHPDSQRFLQSEKTPLKHATTQLNPTLNFPRLIMVPSVPSAEGPFPPMVSCQPVLLNGDEPSLLSYLECDPTPPCLKRLALIQELSVGAAAGRGPPLSFNELRSQGEKTVKVPFTSSLSPDIIHTTIII